MRLLTALGRGFRAIGTLVRWTVQEPSGDASSDHRLWLLLPVASLAMGVAGLAGMILRLQFEIAGLAFSAVALLIGLALVAWVGRAFERGSWVDPGKD